MSQLQKAIQQGLKALKAPALNIQKTATYTTVGTPSYNATTGTVTAPGTVFTKVPMVFDSFSRRDIDGEAVRAEDKQAMVSTLDLDAIPTLNDTVTMADGSVWGVIGIQTDPADAAWILHLRRP